MALRPDPAPAPGAELLPGPRISSAYQLTPLWERVVRTQRLPAEVDLQEVLKALRLRLGDPEREVRQHALRVLADLVPALRSSLDSLLGPLLPALLSNLGHPAPAVRKGALDALRMYISHSDNKEYVISEICTKCFEKSSINGKFQEDVTMGVILALPSLLQPALGFLGSSSNSIISVIKALSSKLFQVIYQEVAMRSLVKLRELIGPRVFEEHINSLDPSVSENFNLLRNVYNFPGSPERNETRANSEEILADDENNKIGSEKSEEMFITEPPSVLLNDENKIPEYHQPTITVDVDDSENIPNGKIILETEFTFDSDTAITMTILEEEENNTNGPPVESEDESFDYTTYNKSVVKVLTDSELEEYEDVRRTPRRVRFGGEIVKMRTPDSDTIQNSDVDDVTGDTSKSSETSNPSYQSGSYNQRNNRENDNGFSNNLKKSRLSRSMIPLPVEPITTRPKARRDEDTSEPLSPSKKRKSKSLNDLSMYCKQHFGLPPKTEQKGALVKENIEKRNITYTPRRKHSSEEIFKKNDLDNLRIVKRNGLVSSSSELSHKYVEQSLAYNQEEYLSGQSGNSSTGSGSSSDNALEDTLEELNTFNDEIFKDLYKMEGQRGALQVLDRLTNRLNTNPDFGHSLDIHQVHVLATRLGALASRARGRAGEAAVLALRALVRSASGRALRGAISALAGALAGAGPRSQALLTEVGRRVPAPDLVEALLDESSPHWRSTKLRAGALRAVSQTARALPCVGVRVQWACARCAACARSPRRRVRAAALDALAALARLCSPRAVLAAVHQEAADHDDGDRLYDAVLARLCRPSAGGGAPAIAVSGPGSGAGGPRRPDLAWVMAGTGDASPPSAHKFSKSTEEWRRAPGSTPQSRDFSDPRGALQGAVSHCRPPPTADPRMQDYNRWEPSMHRMGEARVLTAPPLALRPLALPTPLAGPSQGGAPWGSQAVLWAAHTPTPAEMLWAQKQGSWPPLGGTWAPHGAGVGNAAPLSGSWPARRPPSLLRALSPPQHQPAQGRWGATQGVREDGFSPHAACSPGAPRHSTERGLQPPPSAFILRIR